MLFQFSVFSNGAHVNFILSTSSFLITVFSSQHTDLALCKTELPCSTQERNLQVQDEDEPLTSNLVFKKKNKKKTPYNSLS